MSDQDHPVQPPIAIVATGALLPGTVDGVRIYHAERLGMRVVPDESSGDMGKS
jgi:hypothetical protein